MSTNISVLCCLLANLCSVLLWLMTISHYQKVSGLWAVRLCRAISLVLICLSYLLVDSVLGVVPAAITVLVCWMCAAVFLPFVFVWLRKQ